MSCPKNLTLAPSDCPCLLKWTEPVGCNSTQTKSGSINLHGAKTLQIRDEKGEVVGFHIYGIGCGVKVGIGSDFTQEDVDALICECHSQGGGTGGGIATDVDATIVQDDTLDTVDISPNRVVLDGAGTWIAPATIQSVSYGVVSSGNAGTTPTITTNNGTTALFESEQGGFGIIRDQDRHLALPLSITSSAGDVVVINWTE